jgi:hypothetical protein
MTRLQYLLVKLAEEASEVGQISLKTAQFGLDETYTDLSNKDRVHAELNDLLAIVELLNKEYNFNFIPNPEAHTRKVEKMEYYYNYSKKLGTVK